MFDVAQAERAVQFISLLKHTKGVWYGKPFELLPGRKNSSEIFLAQLKKTVTGNITLLMWKCLRKMVKVNWPLRWLFTSLVAMVNGGLKYMAVPLIGSRLLLCSM